MELGSLLVTDGGLLHVSGVDDGGLGERVELEADGVVDVLLAASGEVGASVGSLEEGVSGEEDARLGEMEADGAGGVSGG